MSTKTADCDFAQAVGTLAASSKTFATLSAWDLKAVENYLRRDGSSVRNVEKAVSEYRKFIFLTISAPHPCVPSHEIDEVWHAHILHSRNYLSFCKEVGRDYIHHDPSPPSERLELDPFFRKTTALYQEIFGAIPEPSVWGAYSMANCVQPGQDCRGTCSHNCQNS